ncbi:MAG: hypothetical protein ABW069_14880 [Duganella sp.]
MSMVCKKTWIPACAGMADFYHVAVAPSFRRRPESNVDGLQTTWIPACAGMADFYPAEKDCLAACAQ